MNKIAISFLVLFLSIQIAGCSHAPPKKVDLLRFPPALEKVRVLINKDKTHDARYHLDNYLNKMENIHWFGHAYYLKGFSYEMDGDLENSTKWYRQAIDHSKKFDGKVGAQALYNLSYVYEKADLLEQASATLVDLLARPQHFDPLTAKVETPARHAAILAGRGKMEQAKKYHRMAASSFQKMVRSNMFRETKEHISHSLYYLGVAVFKNKNETFDELKEKMTMGQKYLMACAEASDSSWSRKAGEHLSRNIEDMWEMTVAYKAKLKIDDALAEKRQTQLKQLEMAADVYDLLLRLKEEEFPLLKVNSSSRAVTAMASEWMGKVTQFAQNLDLGPETLRDNPVRQRPISKEIDPFFRPRPLPKRLRVNKETTSTAPAKKPVEKKVSKAQALPEKEIPGTKEPKVSSGDPNL